jgi:hypothetical protein
MDHEINEQRVRELAYELWEANGRPDGSANRFWGEALAQVRNGGATAKPRENDPRKDARRR